MIEIIMHEVKPPAPFGAIPSRDVNERHLRKGDNLFRQGERPFAMFFVQSGAVSLIRHTEAGRQVRLFRAKSGDTLAEASIFSDNYHCDCVAENDCVLLAFDKQAILRSMSRDPDFSVALIRRLAGQVQIYRRRLELLAIGSAKDRVLAGLSDGWLTGSVIAFSEDLGLTHEATYRALAGLVKEGRARKLGRGRYVAVPR